MQWVIQKRVTADQISAYFCERKRLRVLLRRIGGVNLHHHISLGFESSSEQRQQKGAGMGMQVGMGMGMQVGMGGEFVPASPAPSWVHHAGARGEQAK